MTDSTGTFDTPDSPVTPASPAKPAGKKKWIVAGVIGALLAVLCCAGGVGGYFWLTRPDSPEQVVDKYLTALQTHNDLEALQLTCKSANSGLSHLLNQLIKDNIEIVSWEIGDTVEEKNTATVEVDLDYTVPVLNGAGGPQQAMVTYKLVKQNSDWLVCGNRFGNTNQTFPPSGAGFDFNFN